MREGTPAAMNILSIDWEDFGQLFGMYHHGVLSDPAGGAIERQTGIILDLLEETGNRATFFILGMLARSRPALVRAIAAAGHEVALHGDTHQRMSSLSPVEARRDLETALKTVTDLTGEAVHGYRAPFFSVNGENLYLLEMLSELGLCYDSSIFPLKLPRYGIAGFGEDDALYRLPNGGELVELPLTVAGYFGRKWPVSGGGYLRLMPRALVRKVFGDFHRQGRGSMIYMHPYEFDSEPLDVSSNYPAGAPRDTLKVQARNLRWNLWRGSVTGKIRELLTSYQFTTCIERARHVKSNGIGADLLGREERAVRQLLHQPLALRQGHAQGGLQPDPDRHRDLQGGR